MALGVLAVCACLSPAQVTNSPHHQADVSIVIDGAVHPELIPDSLAYRLYFVALSTGQNPTEVERRRQRMHIMKVGLVESDQEAFISLLLDFRSTYDALVAQI